MATGISSGASKPAFHDPDADQTTEYRSLSVLAVISLVIGLASPLCFGAPLLMIIPVIGIGVSILALRQIDASDGALAGRWAAVLGLVLSVVFLAAPAARAYGIRMLRTSQAKNFAQQWLSDLVEGKTDYAFRLTSDSIKPPAPPEPGEATPKLNAFDHLQGAALGRGHLRRGRGCRRSLRRNRRVRSAGVPARVCPPAIRCRSQVSATPNPSAWC